MEKKSSNILETIIEKAKRENRRVNIYAHKFPDGDAISSCKVLEKVLQDRGIKARYIVKFARVNNRLDSILGKTEKFLGRVGRDDISVILDTSTIDNAENRLFIYSRPENTFVIDHHRKDKKGTIEDDLRLPQRNVYRDSSSSSVCEMLTRMLDEMKQLNPDYATGLTIGLWTDTAKFKFLKPGTLDTFRTLLNSGSDYEKVKRSLDSKRFLSQEVGLAKALLQTKRIKVGNTYLNYLGLDNKSVKDLEQKYNVRDVHKKIFRLNDIENTALALAIAEKEPNNFFCEFRSEKEIGNVDVFSVASSFGGGGHLNASGCTVTSDKGIDRVSRDVLTRLTDRALSSLVGFQSQDDSEYDTELKELLGRMDRFNSNLTQENFQRIQELIFLGAKYETDYEDKISYERFMVRNSILAEIPDSQLQQRVLRLKLSKNFLEKMQSEYGVSEEEVLQEIEIFKEIDVDSVTLMTPSGKSTSIDSKGNIKQYQRRDTEK